MAKIAMTSDKKIMVLNEGVEGIPSITIDSELIDTSTNPVQNKVIKAAIDAVDIKAGNKQDKIGVSGLLKGDGTTISAAVAETDYMVPPTGGTTGQVLKKTENGTEWADAPQTVTIPETTALLKGDGAGGVAAVTTDATPTQGSSNPVTSGGVKTELDKKANATSLDDHISDTTKHITAAERTAWNGKSGKALSFTVTLTAAEWSGNAQTVNNSKFVTSGYAYTVCPAGDSFAGYAEAVIYADDVTTAGKMTFHCNEAPTANLTVNILRTEATA